METFHGCERMCCVRANPETQVLDAKHPSKHPYSGFSLPVAISETSPPLAAVPKLEAATDPVICRTGAC
eukprot:4003250-Pleurochrysis_carterae.AAC.2